MGVGQYCLPLCPWWPACPGPGPSLPPSHPIRSPQVSPPTPGLDQDWSAIAATQCRLDKEGATKLVCDLITSTKNEKVFQESIGLAIRLLDGGNTEIQVRRGVRGQALAARGRGLPRGRGQRAKTLKSWGLCGQLHLPHPPLCHVATFLF